MKYFRSLLLGFGLLVLGALLLVWFLPARWALPRLEPRLHGIRLQQIRGSLWNGSVDQVVGANGRVAGQLQWQLSRSALIGKIHAHWNFQGQAFTISGTMERPSADQIALSNVDMRADMLQFDSRIDTALGEPRGELQLHVDQALLQGDWPVQLQARAQWHDAAMQTPDGLVPLGELEANAQAQGGVVQITLQDDGHGPLQAEGQLQVIPLGWRMDATLQARQPNPMLRQWLSRLGTPDREGRIHIQRRGGLAGSSAANTTDSHTNDSHRTGQP